MLLTLSDEKENGLIANVVKKQAGFKVEKLTIFLFSFTIEANDFMILLLSFYNERT